MKVTRTSRALLSGLLAILVGYPFVKHAIVDPWIVRYEGDFTIYYRAAERLSKGESPYPLLELARADGSEASPIWGEYPYPPLLARVLAPFTYLNVLEAKYAYIGVCLTAFFVLMIRLLRKIVSSRLERWLAAAVLLGWGPFIYTIRLGQSELLAIPFLAGAWLLLLESPHAGGSQRGHGFEFAAGLCLGTAAMVRVTPVLMLPALLVAGRWLLAGGFVTGSLATLVVSGPLTSWEFFTKVMPTMSDVGEMRHCPSFHVLILRTIDALSPGVGNGSWLQNHASDIAVAGSGVFYVGVLLFLFLRRHSLRTDRLVLLGCYLAPLFAGKNPHHYTLALFPVLGASLMFVRTALNGSSGCGWKRWRRLVVWCIALIPSFYYWFPLKIAVDCFARCTSLSSSTLFIMGNVVAFLMINRDSHLLFLTRNGTCPEKRRRSQDSHGNNR